MNHRVVKKCRIGARYQTLTETEQDFRYEERDKRVREGVVGKPEEAKDTPGNQAIPSSPNIGKVSRGDLQGYHGNGIDAFQNENISQIKPAFLVKQDNDRHHQGKPFGNLDQVKGDDIFSKRHAIHFLFQEAKVTN